MRLAPTALLLAAVCCACAGCRTRPADTAGAREVFSRNCASCHGAEGEGRPIGSLRAPSFKSDFVVKLSDEQLYQWIARGGSNMPSFKNSLTEEQMRGLVSYVREIQGGQK